MGQERWRGNTREEETWRRTATTRFPQQRLAFIKILSELTSMWNGRIRCINVPKQPINDTKDDVGPVYFSSYQAVHTWRQFTAIVINLVRTEKVIKPATTKETAHFHLFPTSMVFFSSVSITGRWNSSWSVTRTPYHAWKKAPTS